MKAEARSTVLVGGVPAAGLTTVGGIDDVAENAQIVVVAWPTKIDNALDALRKRVPGARLLAFVAEASAEVIDAAVNAGFDDIAVGEAHLEDRLTRSSHQTLDLTSLGEYDGLSALISEIAEKPSLQQVLQLATIRMSELFSIAKVTVMLFRPEDEFAFVVAERNQRLDNLVIRLGDYPEIQEIIRTREPLLIPDVFGDALLSGVQEKLEEAGVKHRSSLLFPLIRKDQVVGALFLRSPRPLQFLADRELKMGRLIAAITSVAIGNALEQDALLSEKRALLQDKEDADMALASMQNFVDFFEQAHDGIVVTNQQGEIRYANRAAGRILHRDPNDLKSETFIGLLSPQYHRLAHRAISGQEVGGNLGYVDLLVPDAAAGDIVLSAAVRPLSELDSVLISFRDVTELRSIEGELRQTKEFLENLIQSSVDAIIAADTEGVVVLFNRAAEQMVKYSAREAVGKLNITELYPPGEADDVMRRLRSDAYGGRGRLELVRKELVARGGDVVPVNLTASIIYEGDQEIASVEIFTDLRERMKIEAKLSQVQRQLQVSERQAVAVELAGAAAHELNQPLTSILGYAELLRRRLMGSDVNLKPIDVISSETERMAAIVKRIGEITAYKSKTYVGGSTIMDFSDETEQIDKTPRESET